MAKHKHNKAITHTRTLVRMQAQTHIYTQTVVFLIVDVTQQLIFRA